MSMTKKELLKKVAHLKDDDLIVFAGFGWMKTPEEVDGTYCWRLLNLSIPRDTDPGNVISLSLEHSFIYADSLQEMGAIASDLTKQMEA